MKKLKVLILGLMFCLYGLAQSAEATTLSYTDTSLSPGNSITYTLDFSLNSGTTTYDASFTILNSVNVFPEWYAGWFLFKFDGSASTVSNLTAPAGPWSIVNGGDLTKVLQAGTYNQLQINGFTGFYVTSLAEGGATDDPTQGILLTGSPGTSTFNFKFTTPGTAINSTDMPFQVGYYDGLLPNDNYKYGQLSEHLSVPEPNTLLLLGCGLLSLGVIGRKYAKGRR